MLASAAVVVWLPRLQHVPKQARKRLESHRQTWPPLAPRNPNVNTNNYGEDSPQVTTDGLGKARQFGRRPAISLMVGSSQA